MNIHLLADKFWKSIEKDGQTEPVQFEKIAGRKNRKQLERDLNYAKNFYAKYKGSLAGHRKASDDLAAIIDKESTELEKAKKDINRCYDVLRNMDLHDIHEIRMIEDDVGYVRGGRLHRLEDNNLVPFRRKQVVDDLEDGADELLASLED